MNKRTNKKPLVIYHGNCADGFGAAWVFRRFSGEECDFHAGVYQTPPPDVTGRDVFMLDFSYKRPAVEKMLETAYAVTLIDHHKSAIEDLQPLIDAKKIKAFVDVAHSGAMLTWMYLRGDLEPPQLIKHIEDRDLWKFSLKDTRPIQAAVFSYPYDFDVWDAIMEMPIDALAAEGTGIERKHHKDIAELLAVCKREMCISGVTVPVASLPYTLSSDAGHVMGEGRPFAACYWDTATARIFSLRSSEQGVDVSEVAKKYGGGGHKHAAGFSVPRDHPLAVA